MKIKLFILFLASFAFISCRAQILPIEEEINYLNTEDGFPDNITHVKDVNNLLDKYVGTWIGTYNGRIYEFIITKVTYESLGILWDKLYLYYKITQNGEIIEDTTSLMPNYQNNTGGLIQQVPDFMLATGDLLMNRTYTFNYNGRNADCGQFGTIYISVGWDNNPNKMKLYLLPGGDHFSSENCTEIANHILPLDQTAFYRQ
jgi:hypothetical protein